MKKLIILIVLFSINFSLFSQNNDVNIWKRYTGEINDSNIPVLPNYSYAGYKLGNEAIPEDSNLQIFDVTDYGAIADDSKSDQQAIQDAIKAAEANNGGVVFFPPGEFLISTDPKKTPSIKVSKSNIIIKGSGSTPCGGTILNMKNHILKPSGASDWHTPEMFQFEAPGASTRSTQITENRKRGDFTIKVKDAGIFKNKKYAKLKLDFTTKANEDFLDSKKPRKVWSKILDDGISLSEIHEIESVNTSNNTITFKDPVVDDIKSSYGWKAETINLLENCGFEDIHFKGNFFDEFQHHKNYIHDYAWDAIEMKSVAHSWVRRCRFSNVSSAVGLGGAYACSLIQLVIDGNRSHATNIVNGGSTRILQGLIWDNTSKGQFHGVDMSNFTSGSVVWRIETKGRGWDLHAAQPRTNLIDMYESADLSASGGNYKNNPNHLSGLTIWNQKRTGKDVSNFDFWNDCGGNYCGTAVVNPIIVGMHGSKTTFRSSNVKYEESNGRKASPESLYEAQLAHRLTKSPQWVSDAISKYNDLKVAWYSTSGPDNRKVTFSLPKLPNQGSQTIEEGESIQIEAITSAGIDAVKLYMNDKLLRQENTAPFEWGHRDDLDPELKNLAVGVYNLKLVAVGSGCDGKEIQDSIIITVEEALSTTDYSINNAIKIYPNPITSDNLIIDLSNENINDTTLQIALYNLQGKLIQKTTSQNLDTKITYKINEDISNSIYFITLKAKGYNKSKRIVLKR